MFTRPRLSALLAAGGLLMAIASVAFAAPPSYALSVTKTADPAGVPPGGASVEFTIAVTGTGSGFFRSLAVEDGMAGCTVAGPFGDQVSGAGAGRLESGETWTYTCTVAGVLPGATNSATVNGCHDLGACGTDHDATNSDSVTLGLGAADPSDPPASDPPPSEPPVSEPPASEPPASEPPASAPPVSEPPASAPPASEPPASDPPASDPPASDPPISGPASDPPVSDPPVSDPPPSDAPGSDSPASDAPGSVGPAFDDDELGEGAGPSEPATDALSTHGPTPPGELNPYFLVAAVALMLASVLVHGPEPARRRR